MGDDRGQRAAARLAAHRGPRGVLCLIGPDGHVLAIASERIPEARLAFNLRVLAEIGVGGFSTGTLPLGEAARRLAEGHACPGCAIRFPCGCDPEPTEAGLCPHGTREALQAAAVRLARLTAFTG